jgi:hypothetical protein
MGVPNVEVTGPKLTAGFDSRGGPRSEATTGARRTKLAVNLWSGAETRWAFCYIKICAVQLIFKKRLY